MEGLICKELISSTLERFGRKTHHFPLPLITLPFFSLPLSYPNKAFVISIKSSTAQSLTTNLMLLPLFMRHSWSPAGALRAGRNPATYRSHGEVMQVSGDKLYDSAVRFRLPDFPAFALEVLPNRNSLIYGDVYNVRDEASTIFRGTLRYEGFSEIMGTLARIGFFDTEPLPILESSQSPTFKTFTLKLLDIEKEALSGTLISENDIAEKIKSLGHCKQEATALKTARTIMFLGLHEHTLIPSTCKTAFDVMCRCMEEKLAYSETEQILK